MPDGAIRVAKDHRSAHSVMLLARGAPQDGRLFAQGTAAVVTLGTDLKYRVMMRLNGRLIQ